MLFRALLQTRSQIMRQMRAKLRTRLGGGSTRQGSFRGGNSSSREAARTRCDVCEFHASPGRGVAGALGGQTESAEWLQRKDLLFPDPRPGAAHKRSCASRRLRTLSAAFRRTCATSGTREEAVT